MLAAQARDIRLQCIVDPTVSVAGDPGRLQQVFWNLLSNGVKFTPGNGYIRVVMERVNSHVEVKFADSGQGMTAEFIAHAFERFRQSESLGTQQTGGLGLGLSLAKHLIEMHGGSISAYSPGEGLGSTFTVHLPLSVVQVAQGEQRIHPAALSTSTQSDHVSLRGITVLIADDERDARELLWRVLTDAGAEVIATSSAAEALEAAERVRPDVLVSDVSMPGGDGYELIRKVRMLGDATGRVPAIALSALSRLEDRTRALLSGFQLHLSKPVDPRELTLAIASLAGRLPAVPRDPKLP
jgi:CheY-like chemotaxis protein